MAVEITLANFERNAKMVNKKGLRRTYSSIENHPFEYVGFIPLGTTNKVVFEVTIDKEFVDKFITNAKQHKMMILGAINYYHIENLMNDYEERKNYFSHQEEAFEAISNDLKNMKANKAKYEETSDGDCKLYMVPYNDEVETLEDFVNGYSKSISRFAKKHDITIMLNVISANGQLTGFFGYNFFDADKPNEEITVDFASQLTLGVDFKKAESVYIAGLLINGIAKTEEGLVNMNLHILAENSKYSE